jgi:hypothetical protein
MTQLLAIVQEHPISLAIIGFALLSVIAIIIGIVTMAFTKGEHPASNLFAMGIVSLLITLIAGLVLTMAFGYFTGFDTNSETISTITTV